MNYHLGVVILITIGISDITSARGHKRSWKNSELTYGLRSSKRTDMERDTERRGRFRVDFSGEDNSPEITRFRQSDIYKIFRGKLRKNSKKQKSTKLNGRPARKPCVEMSCDLFRAQNNEFYENCGKYIGDIEVGNIYQECLEVPFLDLEKFMWAKSEWCSSVCQNGDFTFNLCPPATTAAPPEISPECVPMSCELFLSTSNIFWQRCGRKMLPHLIYEIYDRCLSVPREELEEFFWDQASFCALNCRDGFFVFNFCDSTPLTIPVTTASPVEVCDCSVFKDHNSEFWRNCGKYLSHSKVKHFTKKCLAQHCQADVRNTICAASRYCVRKGFSGFCLTDGQGRW